MLDSADIDPTPQILTKGVPRSYTHCVALSKSIFKLSLAEGSARSYPPTPYTILYHNATKLNLEIPPGAK